MNRRTASGPPQERNPATLSAKIYRDDCFSTGRRGHANPHKRKQALAASAGLLSQECFRQPAVHRDQVSRGALSFWPCKKENSGSAVARINGTVRQRASGIKLGKKGAEVLIRGSVIERNGVFL